jgi:hypothetical protein
MNQLSVQDSFRRYRGSAARNPNNLENTLAETFNLERLARYSIISHP